MDVEQSHLELNRLPPQRATAGRGVTAQRFAGRMLGISGERIACRCVWRATANAYGVG
jgi:hypothetical protein